MEDHLSSCHVAGEPYLWLPSQRLSAKSRPFT